MFTVWHRLSSLVLIFPGLRIEALPLSTVKRRTRKFNFHSYVLNLVQINRNVCLSKVGSPGADLLASRAEHVLLVWPTYRPTVPQQPNRAGRFIDQTCQLDKIFRPIYRPTASKRLKKKTCSLTKNWCVVSSPYDWSEIIYVRTVKLHNFRELDRNKRN